MSTLGTSDPNGGMLKALCSRQGVQRRSPKTQGWAEEPPDGIAVGTIVLTPFLRRNPKEGHESGPGRNGILPLYMEAATGRCCDLWARGRRSWCRHGGCVGGLRGIVPDALTTIRDGFQKCGGAGRAAWLQASRRSWTAFLVKVLVQASTRDGLHPSPVFSLLGATSWSTSILASMYSTTIFSMTEVPTLLTCRIAQEE